MPGGYGQGYPGGYDPNQTPITPVDYTTPTPPQYGGGSAGSYGGGEEEAYAPYYSDPGVGTPVIETWNEENIDYLNGTLVSDLPITPSLPTVPTQATLDMQAALAIKNKYDMSLYPGQTDGKANVPWTDKDLLAAQDLGLFSAEAAAMDVTGLEAETNKMKGSLVNKLKKLKYQASQGAWGWGSNDPKDPMNKHIDKQIMKNLMESDEWKAVGNLFGDDILGAVSTFGAKGAIDLGIIDPNDPATKNYFSQTAEGYDMGYDPSGTKTWSDIESDPYLYESYNKLLGGNLTPDELRKYLPAMGYQDRPEQAWQDPNQGRYSRSYGGGQRERNLALLQYLNKGLPIKQLEKSGFMASMKDPYAESTERARTEGIFKDVIPGGAFTPRMMKQLIKTYASGKASPRYANVARGGIMSAWNDMRR